MAAVRWSTAVSVAVPSRCRALGFQPILHTGASRKYHSCSVYVHVSRTNDGAGHCKQCVCRQARVYDVRRSRCSVCLTS